MTLPPPSPALSMMYPFFLTNLIKSINEIWNYSIKFNSNFCLAGIMEQTKKDDNHGEEEVIEVEKVEITRNERVNLPIGAISSNPDSFC